MRFSAVLDEAAHAEAAEKVNVSRDEWVAKLEENERLGTITVADRNSDGTPRRFSFDDGENRAMRRERERQERRAAKRARAAA